VNHVSSDQSDTFFVVNVQVILLRGGKVLLIGRGPDESHAPDVLDLPGGKLEMTELGAASIENCARRELKEETGIEYSGHLSYVTSALFVADDGVAVANLVMKGDLAQDVCVALNPGEDETGCFWFPLSDLDSEARMPSWTKDYIRQGLAAVTTEL
jgi:8-oxo-dGTP diphosphatase